jgi:hypothetical protein
MYIVFCFKSSWVADEKDFIHVVQSEAEVAFHYLVLGTWTIQDWTVSMTILNNKR